MNKNTADGKRSVCDSWVHCYVCEKNETLKIKLR